MCSTIFGIMIPNDLMVVMVMIVIRNNIRINNVNMPAPDQQPLGCLIDRYHFWWQMSSNCLAAPDPSSTSVYSSGVGIAEKIVRSGSLAQDAFEGLTIYLILPMSLM